MSECLYENKISMVNFNRWRAIKIAVWL